MPQQKTVYLETMGCQMNVLDSELIMGQLRRMGYEPTERIKSADLVLLNTCSVRQRAEDKVYARLGEVRHNGRKHNGDQIIGVIGCMAERDRDGLLQKCPQVDILCGPSDLNKVPSMVQQVRESRRRAVSLLDDLSRRTPVQERSFQFDTVEALDLSREPDPQAETTQAYVRVQRGCDKFCTFCVVPFTRGPERSRPPSHIVREVKMLADRGVKEVTLLGQTVNSYVHVENARTVRFADLLDPKLGRGTACVSKNAPAAFRSEYRLLAALLEEARAEARSDSGNSLAPMRARLKKLMGDLAAKTQKGRVSRRRLAMALRPLESSVRSALSRAERNVTKKVMKSKRPKESPAAPSKGVDHEDN